MPQLIIRLIAIVCLSIMGWVVGAEDDGSAVPYVQTSTFNVPLLEGWENQSSEDFTQFYYPSARAFIRTALVRLDDVIAAAKMDLSDAFGIEVGEPLYRDKVNLADGTWTVLIYEPDARTTASVMARKVQTETVVISLVESDPVGRIFMATVAQSGGTRPDAKTEIDLAVRKLTFPRPSFEEHRTLTLPSGDWTHYSGRRYTAMGLVFGNDSYVAIAELAGDTLPLLADAYNRTLLGFFVTPDNTRYLMLGLAATAIVLFGLIFSFVWRARNLRKDLELIDELAQAED